MAQVWNGLVSGKPRVALTSYVASRSFHDCRTCDPSDLCIELGHISSQAGVPIFVRVLLRPLALADPPFSCSPQNFVGSNNVNVLMPGGQFGTRLQGGKDAASPRYIFTKLSPVTRALFHLDDDPLLNYLNDDGQSIEPGTISFANP